MMAAGAARSAPDAAAVAARLLDVRERIGAACAAAGRSPREVTLVAVTKAASADAAAAAVRAGVAHLGENRVADGAARRAAVEARLAGGAGGAVAPPTWHLIGRLQTNKVRAALAAFDVVDSVGSLRLARRLDAIARSLGRVVPVLLQVDLSDGAPGRNGFPPDGAALAEAASAVAAYPGLFPHGLMAIAPLGLSAAATRAAFERVRALRDGLARDVAHPSGWRTLSMGMTGDFELAIAAGATEVRVGGALFASETLAASG